MTRSSTNPFLPVALLASALALAACSSAPEPETFGSRVTAEGGAVSAIGKQWTEGDKMVADGQRLTEKGRDQVDDGERMVRKGEERISDGRDKIRRGERMIADGEKLKRQAEEQYRMNRTGIVPQG